MQEREYRQTMGTKISAETEMNSCQNAIPDIAAHILATQSNHIYIFGK